MNSRILIFPPTLCNSLLSLIILVVKLLQIGQPLQAGFFVLVAYLHHFFKSSSLFSSIIRCSRSLLYLPCTLPPPLRDSCVWILICHSVSKLWKTSSPLLFTHWPSPPPAKAHHLHHHHHENSGLTWLPAPLGQGLWVFALACVTSLLVQGHLKCHFCFTPDSRPGANRIVPSSVFP